MTEGAEPFLCDHTSVLKQFDSERLKKVLCHMLLIRYFEQRAEAAYQQGKIGGFLHLYIGQEAIQTGLIEAIGKTHWFATSYRCHALALLLEEPLDSLMKELFGKDGGNALGRGGSMHLYSDHMLGGFGIVGGQISVATGAAFSCKYLKEDGRISVCFLGDGAVPQGPFHESLTLASLYNLPCLYVVENNNWSMGTPLARTMANHQQFLEKAAAAYNVGYMRLDGMDFLGCYAGFCEAYTLIQQTGRPLIVECMTERFKGHSISDPGTYRSKEDVKKCMERDPIRRLKEQAQTAGYLTDEAYVTLDKECREAALKAAQAADVAPWPDPTSLEKGVFAPPLDPAVGRLQ